MHPTISLGFMPVHFKSSIQRIEALVEVLDAEALINSVNGGGSMAHKTHGFIFGYSSARETRSGGDAQTVKTDPGFHFAETVLVKEPLPVSALVLRDWGLGVRLSAPLAPELLEERDQVGVHRDRVQPSALDAEIDRAGFPAVFTSGDGDVGHRIEIGFREAAALVATNLKTVFVKLVLLAITFLFDALPNVLNLFVGKVGLFLRRPSFDAQAAAGVGVRVLAKHGFLHQHTQNFHFQKHGLLACAVFAAWYIGLFAPLEILGAMFPPQVSGRADAFLVQEHLERAPGAKVSRQGVGIMVADREVIGHPFIPFAFQAAPVPGVLKFLRFGRGPHLFGLARAWAVVDRAAGALAAHNPIAVAILEPPIGRLGALKKAGHECTLVYLRLRNLAKNSAKNMVTARKFQHFQQSLATRVRIPLSPPFSLSTTCKSSVPRNGPQYIAIFAFFRFAGPVQPCQLPGVIGGVPPGLFPISARIGVLAHGITLWPASSSPPAGSVFFDAFSALRRGLSAPGGVLAHNVVRSGFRLPGSSLAWPRLKKFLRFLPTGESPVENLSESPRAPAKASMRSDLVPLFWFFVCWGGIALACVLVGRIFIRRRSRAQPLAVCPDCCSSQIKHGYAKAGPRCTECLDRFMGEI